MMTYVQQEVEIIVAHAEKMAHAEIVAQGRGGGVETIVAQCHYFRKYGTLVGCLFDLH